MPTRTLLRHPRGKSKEQNHFTAKIHPSPRPGLEWPWVRAQDFPSLFLTASARGIKWFFLGFCRAKPQGWKWQNISARGASGQLGKGPVSPQTSLRTVE